MASRSKRFGLDLCCGGRVRRAAMGLGFPRKIEIEVDITTGVGWSKSPTDAVPLWKS
jgi:hypothetical protein